MEPISATRITWRDAILMPEDGNRYEAIEGELYVTPPPKVLHQLVSIRLIEALVDLLVKPGYGQLFQSPIGVEFPDTDEGIEPDIVFVRRERFEIVHEDWIRGAPDLVVEILSPSTASRDRSIKRKLYQRQGVAEYWIVDNVEKTIDVWDFAQGATAERSCTDAVQVQIAGRIIGSIELAPIFTPLAS